MLRRPAPNRSSPFALLPSPTPFFPGKDRLRAGEHAGPPGNCRGIYTVAVSLAWTANKICPAEKTVVIQEHLSLPAASVARRFITGCVPSGTPVWLHAVTNAQSPTYVWTYDGQTLSINDSCQFVFSGLDWARQPGASDPVVTDAYGCSVVASDGTSVVQNGNAPLLSLHKENLCNGLTEISYEVYGGAPPYQSAWNNPGILTNPFESLRAFTPAL